MAKEFRAKEIDMDLVLTTLSGEELTMSPRNKMSTDESMRIMTAWSSGEDDEDNINKLSESLEVVYDKPASWWSANFDFKTLSDIVVFVAETIGGVQKKK